MDTKKPTGSFYEKTDRVFVGRDEIVNDVINKSKNLDESKVNLFYYYGVAGVGKSRLLKEIQKKASEQYPPMISLYFALEEVKDMSVDRILSFIRRNPNLNRKDIPKEEQINFGLFDYANFIYLSLTNPHFTTQKEAKDLVEKSEFLSDIFSLLNTIPQIRLLTSLIELIKKGINLEEKYRLKLFEEDLRDFDLLEQDPKKILDQLPFLFAKDLHRHLEETKQHTMIIFDTYETLYEDRSSLKFISEKEKWLFDTDKGLIVNLPGILWVIGGRDPIPWKDRHPDWGKSIVETPLLELDKKSSIDLLQNYKVTSPNLQEQIYLITKGNPFYLNLAIDVYCEFKKDDGIIENEYFKKIDTPYKLQELFLSKIPSGELLVLYVLSFCNMWNDEIVNQLSIRFTLDRSNLDFNRSFINRQVDGETFSMHSLMKECLKKQSMQIKPEIIHETMFEFYKGKLENIENRYVAENDDKALIEASNHGFFEVGSIVDPNEFFAWFGKFTIVFSNAGKWQLLLDLFEKSIRSDSFIHFNDTLKAWILDRLGDYCGKLHEYKKSRSYFVDALSIFRSLAKVDPEKYYSDVAMTLNNLGNMVSSLHEWDEAKEYFKEALKIYNTLPRSYCPVKAIILNNIGNLETLQHDWTNARKHYEEALNIRRDSVMDSSETNLSDLAFSLNNLGILEYHQHEWSQARENFNEAISIRRGLLHNNPQFVLPELAGTLNNLGSLLSDMQDWKQAMESFEEALNIHRILAKDNPQTYLPDLASTLNNLGDLKYKLQEFEKARNYLTEGLDIYRILTQDGSLTYLANMSMNLNNLGALLIDIKEWEIAKTHLEDALGIRRKLAKKNPQAYLCDVAMTLNNLGNVLSDLNEGERARASYSEALDIQSDLAINYPKPYLPEVAKILYNLGNLAKKENKLEIAKKHYTESLDVYERINEQNLRIHNNVISWLKEIILKL